MQHILKFINCTLLKNNVIDLKIEKKKTEMVKNNLIASIF